MISDIRIRYGSAVSRQGKTRRCSWAHPCMSTGAISPAAATLPLLAEPVSIMFDGLENTVRDCPSEERWDSVADLAVHRGSVAGKSKVIREALDSGRLPD